MFGWFNIFEKVKPLHPDKPTDRVMGALFDLACKLEERPKVAVEVLLGHGVCHIIAESGISFLVLDVAPIVKRIRGFSRRYERFPMEKKTK